MAVDRVCRRSLRVWIHLSAAEEIWLSEGCVPRYDSSMRSAQPSD
jgi:hypothetical protein